MKSAIKLLLFVAIVGGLYVLYYSGYFTKVVLEEKEMGPYTLIYQQTTGDYAKVGPIISTLYDKLAYDEQIKLQRSFGIYYDNPKVVAMDQLRSDVGLVLDDAYLTEVPRLGAKYQIKLWAVQKAVVAEFPYKGQVSIVAGMFKVYPLLQKYFSEKGYAMQPVMEIYDAGTKKIYYVVPIK